METLTDETVCILSSLSGLYCRMVREEMRRSGRFPGELHLLHTICESPGGQVTPSQASRMMHMRPPTLSPIVGRLEDQGLLVRVPSRTDRRKTYLEATEEGRAVYRKSHESMLRFYRGMAQGLSHQEVETFLSLLKKVTRPYLAKPMAKEVRPSC